MRWLFLKDLQILRRSPLLVALLVLYPIVIATLIGFALSRGPSKPRVAILNQVPSAASTIDLGGQRVDISRYSNQLFSRIEPVDVASEQEARAKVASGDVAVAVAVSLMFVTLLLAAGILALEPEENAFLRLVRGRVSRTGLLMEKIGLAAICALVVSLVMLSGIAIFVSLAWGRFPLWLAALALGALSFGAMGVAIGGLTREVRAASLLAFMLSLPIAFLALVPSGSVSEGLFQVIKVISALFPFKPTLQALDAALNRSGGIGLPLVHLAVLTLAFGVIARLALRRFA